MAAGPIDSEAVRRSWPAIEGTPVFLYHEIADEGDDGPHSQKQKYAVTPRQFRDQLARIRNGGYQVCSVREIAEPSGSVRRNSLAGVTFDDGCCSDYEKAFPLLLEAGSRADFFLNTANIEKPGYLNWEQVREMCKAGMAFHSHGHSHVALSRLDPVHLERELRVSRGILEDKLGSAVEFLAAPYGLLNRRVIQEAFRLGYRGVCTSRQWTASWGNRCVNRVAILGRTSAEEFRQLLVCRPLPYILRSMRSAAIYLPKQILLRIQPTQLGVQVVTKHG
jgi:peptidoglycan/xylan/chitin deacetylase (PgdA/CDA1 family)